jgi:hypothetical protein
MKTYSPPRRRVQSRHRNENWPGASPQEKGTAARRAIGNRRPCGAHARGTVARKGRETRPVRQLQKESIELVTLDDVLALVMLVATAVAVLSGVVYAGHRILTEVTRYTTMDLFRMISAIP